MIYSKIIEFGAKFMSDLMEKLLVIIRGSLIFLSLIVLISCTNRQTLSTEQVVALISNISGVDISSTSDFKLPETIHMNAVETHYLELSKSEFHLLVKSIDNNRRWKTQPRKSDGTDTLEWERIEEIKSRGLNMIVKVKSNSRSIKIYLYPRN